MKREAKKHPFIVSTYADLPWIPAALGARVEGMVWGCAAVIDLRTGRVARGSTHGDAYEKLGLDPDTDIRVASGWITNLDNFSDGAGLVLSLSAKGRVRP